MISDSDSERVPLKDAEQIAHALGGMQPGNPVLQNALRLLRGETIESALPLQASLREPHPSRWRERLAAAWTLGRARLTEEESDSASGTLIDVLENGFRENGRSKLARWFFRTYAPAFVVALVAATAFALEGPNYGEPPWLGMIILITWMVGTMSLFITVPLQSHLERRLNDRVRAAAAEALAHRNHVEAVGPLAGCLFDSDPGVKAASATALHELLPRIKDSDYGILGADSMAKLGRALTFPDGSLVTKVLDALEMVGTSHAARHIERLLSTTRSTLTRDRARRVLDTLEDRARREAAGKDLLRAARSPADPGALLRPARTQAEAEIEQLLRPSGENLN